MRSLVALSLLITASLVITSGSILAHDSFEPELEAKAYIVYDVKNDKVLLSKNSHAQLPLASLTKLMTAYAARELGSAATMEEMCFMLVTSSNEIAIDIGGRIGGHTGDGPTRLNMWATVLDLPQTFYLNTTGLDISETLSGAYGSAQDMARIISVVENEHPKLLRCSIQGTARYGDSELSNTNKEVGRTIGLIGSKTGLTDLAGGNLAVIIDVEINRPVIIVVLGSSEEGRFPDIDILREATIRLLNENL